MTTRHQLFTSLLPLAAIALLATGPLGSAGGVQQPTQVTEATTLDAAPRSRGPIRGARPAPVQPADSRSATAADNAFHADHPRRLDGSRSLPQPDTDLTLTAAKPRLNGPRGARD